MEQLKIGEVISKRRKELGLSQNQLAQAVGISFHEPAIIRLNQEKPINQGFALIQSYLFKPIGGDLGQRWTEIENLHQRSQKCPSLMRPSCGF